MTDETLNERLTHAHQQIQALPEPQRAELLAMLQETRERHAQLKANFSRCHEAIDEWRLTMKYLIFDRDASRREAADLRRRLADLEGQAE